LISSGPLESKGRFLESILKLKEMGYQIFLPVKDRQSFLEKNGIEATMLYWPKEKEITKLPMNILLIGK